MFLFYLNYYHCHRVVSDSRGATPLRLVGVLNAPPPVQAVLSKHPAVQPALQSVPVTAHAAAPTLCVLFHPPGPAYLEST